MKNRRQRILCTAAGKPRAAWNSIGVLEQGQKLLRMGKEENLKDFESKEAEEEEGSLRSFERDSVLVSKIARVRKKEGERPRSCLL